MKIKDFRDDYWFLSNFFRCRFTYNEFEYKSVEHAFQAAKAIEKKDHDNIAASKKPGEAKRWGRLVSLRQDWEKVKDGIMYDIVKAKFEQNLGLKKLLLDTGDAELLEGNTWGDVYWGVNSISEVGQNKLGKILMRVREELSND